MCLDTKTKIYKTPTRQNKWKTGYKVLEKRNGKLWFPFHRWAFVVPNEIMEDDSTGREEVYSTGQSYQLGYHIFTNLEDAQRYLKTGSSKSPSSQKYGIFSVQYRRVTARGTQHIDDGKGSAPCVVARHMIVGDEV